MLFYRSRENASRLRQRSKDEADKTMGVFRFIADSFSVSNTGPGIENFAALLCLDSGGFVHTSFDSGHKHLERTLFWRSA